jgi:hypothetical protein
MKSSLGRVRIGIDCRSMASAIGGGPSGLEAGESQNYPVFTPMQRHAVCTLFLGYSIVSFEIGQLGKALSFQARNSARGRHCLPVPISSSWIRKFRTPDFVWAGPVWAANWARKSPTSGERPLGCSCCTFFFYNFIVLALKPTKTKVELYKIALNLFLYSN